MLDRQVWSSWTVDDLLRYATNHPLRNALLCSVGANPMPTLLTNWPKGVGLFELNAQTPLPFVNGYRTPETLGKDRLAAVAGAQALFPAQNCLAVDAGTCVTYELLRADGHYLGGNIAPGLRMRLRAMHEFTARLPAVQSAPLNGWLGYSTETAMRNGATLGLVWEVKGHWQNMQREFGDTQVVLTGGDAETILRESGEKWTWEPNLVLIGLNRILDHLISN
jgi:type III pantothenate kinase